jgi:hypothetical protein
MSIEKFTVSRNNSIYQAWPDVALTKGGKLICVFTQCNHHLDRNNSRLMLCESADRGRHWTESKPLTEQCTAQDYWNNARITRLKDDSLVIISDKVPGSEDGSQAPIYMWKGDSEGDNWQEPFMSPAYGIVPDKLHELQDGRWILSAHCRNEQTKKLQQNLWYSDNKGENWSGPVVVGSDERYNLCEASILELPDGTLVAFMRENSWRGLDCMKSISHDRGETWQGVYNVPLPACHRPVSGFLQSGHIMISHRFMQGGKGCPGNWTQNLFAALTDVESARETERDKQGVRIMPVDFDRSPVSDLGYTGWVQFDDGEIYMVNYIVDDAPKGQIRGYSFRESDFIMEAK